MHQASVESEKENDAKRRVEALREEQLKTRGDVLGEEGFSQVGGFWGGCGGCGDGCVGGWGLILEGGEGALW